MDGVSTGIRIRKLSYTLGAEIIGVDITKPVDAPTRDVIYKAFLDHSVLLFRGRQLTREQQLAFGALFGEIVDNSDLRRNSIPGYPGLQLNRPKPDPKATNDSVDKDYGGKMDKYSGMLWHSDRANLVNPTKASILRAVEIPEVGGNTLFSNMYMAYDALSDGIKKMIDGLFGLQPGGGNYIDHSSKEKFEESVKRNPPIAQPIVRVHPETGRKSIFITERVKQIAGMSIKDSQPILQYLFQHCANFQFLYWHTWEPHDILMWDNRCTWHKAVGNYDKSLVRHIEKCSIAGEPSGGYAYDGPIDGPRWWKD